MSASDTDVISQKLDMMIRLIALSVVEGKKQRDQFVILSKAGFQPRDIAEIIGTTSNTVRVELSKLRKHGAMKSNSKRKSRG